MESQNSKKPALQLRAKVSELASKNCNQNNENRDIYQIQALSQAVVINAEAMLTVVIKIKIIIVRESRTRISSEITYPLTSWLL